MRSIESEGDSIDEAIEKALQVLQLARDRVAIEILSDATRGIFGLGGKKARVRATVREALSPAADGSRFVPRDTKTAEPAQRRSRTVAEEIATTVTPAALREMGERAGDVLGKLIGYLGVASEVSVDIGGDPPAVTLRVTGDAGGLVIGRRGQTLDALEYLVNRIATRGNDGAARIMIDVEHYRERRQEHLEQLAHRLAEKARVTGRPVTLNPMSPRDRRIVHLALQDAGDVSTRSQGEGVYRKVTIVPSRKTARTPPARST